MTTTITSKAPNTHHNGVEVARAINAAVVANGRAVVTAAQPVHLDAYSIAQQISAATGQPCALMHADPYSIGKAIEASIALM